MHCEFVVKNQQKILRTAILLMLMIALDSECRYYQTIEI